MGVVRSEELFAWKDGNRIFCDACGDPGEANPLTENDFEEGDVVICDGCKERIL